MNLGYRSRRIEGSSGPAVSRPEHHKSLGLPRPEKMYNVGSGDTKIWRREPKYGNTAVRSTAVRDESLDEFLASFASSVAVAATIQVKAGKAKFNPDIPGGGHLERHVKDEAEKAALAAPTGFVAGADVASKVEEAWPEADHAIFKTAERELRAAAAEQEKKDSASVFSKAAESVKSRLARTIKPDGPDGPAELPPALFIADARHRKERIDMKKTNAKPAQRMWGKVREAVGNAGKDYLASKKMAFGHKEKVRDSALAPDTGEYVPPMDPKDAIFAAAVAAHARSKAEKSESGEKEGQPGEEEADDAASLHSRAPLNAR